MAELADALDLGSSSKEWGFKSSCPHQKKLLSFGATFFKHKKTRANAGVFYYLRKNNMNK